jgi:hypothetical protein
MFLNSNDARDGDIDPFIEREFLTSIQNDVVSFGHNNIESLLVNQSYEEALKLLGDKSCLDSVCKLNRDFIGPFIRFLCLNGHPEKASHIIDGYMYSADLKNKHALVLASASAYCKKGAFDLALQVAAQTDEAMGLLVMTVIERLRLAAKEV